MRILQINNYHQRRGGADVVYLNTVYLLEKHGHHVICFSQKNERNVSNYSTKYFIDHIDYFALSTFKKIINTPRFFFSFEARNKLEELINIEKPELAHVHLYKGTLTPSILLTLKKYKIPTIITLHDFGLLCPHNLFLNGKNQICEKCIKSTPLNCIIYKCNNNNLILSIISSFEYIFHNHFIPYHKYFNKIITVSKYSYEKHCLRRKLIELLVHCYNFYPDSENFMTNQKKGTYFLYYGRLSSEKGIMTLLKAWVSVIRSSKLIIVGDGPLKEEIRQFILMNKIDNIDLPGYKQGKELTSYISNASFIIVPSQVYENNPMSIVEAYSLGKPVIASNIGGIPEIVLENETGFTFEMSNLQELSSLISKTEKMSQEQYQFFSNNALKFSHEHFSEKKHYESLMTIYNDLLQKSIFK